jgi:hypothetical protein
MAHDPIDLITPANDDPYNFLQVSLYSFKSIRRICDGETKHGPLTTARPCTAAA